MIARNIIRVEDVTKPEVSARIHHAMEDSVRGCAARGEAAIRRRLHDLEFEWDMERIVEAHAAGLALGGLALGALANRRWYLLSAVALGFLFQHSLQGWYPLVPILRRAGVRTLREIDLERRLLSELLRARQA